MMGKSFENAFDNYVNWLVLFFFLTAVNLVMEASAYLTSEATGEALRAWARWPARGASVAVLVAIIFWLPRVKRFQKQKGRHAFFDEYVTDIIKRSAFVAFILTICLVGILDVITNDTQLPADFFIKLPGISLSAGFSISFFLSNRSSGDLSEDGGTE